MTAQPDATGRQRLRTLYDVAQLLESADGPDARALHVLELLQPLVPYDQCALLEVQPARAPRLLMTPAASPEERARLTEMLMSLFGQLLEDQARATERRASPAGAHLAVPLVGLDQVIGVLFVRSAKALYGEPELRALSLVAANLAAYFTMLRDRAALGERAGQLEEARRTALAANHAKDEFLALVSHQLQAPLTSTLGWVHVLRSQELQGAERARAIDSMERNLRAQAKLVADMLELSCVATAELRLELRSLEPAGLIKAAVEDLRPQAAQRAIRLNADLDRSVKLLGDPDRLDHVVAILLENAIQSTPDGGEVAVQLEKSDKHARIHVTDGGKRVRVKGSSVLGDGAPIGLPIVKQLVELHGGRVLAPSPGETSGASVTVELPLAGAAVQTVEKRRALTGIRVLVVDDELEIRDALKFLLEHYGALVTVAGSVAEALAALQRSMPDVLLSDIAMPGETGYELVRKLAARESGGALPAAALSGFSSAEDRRQSLEAGFRLHLAKPVEPEALIAAVARLAGRTLDAGTKLG